MSTETRKLVHWAMTRLSAERVFVTVVPGPRDVVDDVLCGVMDQWDPAQGQLEFRVVTSARVQGLVIAAGPQAEHQVRTVAAGFLMPVTERLSNETAEVTAPKRSLWRTFPGLVAAIAPAVRNRRRAP